MILFALAIIASVFLFSLAVHAQSPLTGAVVLGASSPLNVCGDGICQATESTLTCATDCRLPILAWSEVTQSGTISSLRYSACTNDACSSLAPLTLSFAGDMVNIQYGSDHLPILAFVSDSPAQTLQVVKCLNIACSQRVYTQIDSAAPDYISNVRLEIAPTGMPLIAYVRGNFSHDSLIFHYCANLACTSGTSQTVYDAPGPNTLSSGTQWFNVAFRADGKPVASVGRNDLVAGPQATLVSCADPACTNSQSTIFTETQYILESAISVRADGVPMVASSNLATGSLDLIRCLDRGCISRAAPITLANAASPIIGRQPNGYTDVLYRFWSLPQTGLGITICQTRDCATHTNRVLTSLDAGLPATVNGTDGRKMFFYQDESTGNLRRGKCQDSTCASVNDASLYHSPLPQNRLSSLSVDR